MSGNGLKVPPISSSHRGKLIDIGFDLSRTGCRENRKGIIFRVSRFLDLLTTKIECVLGEINGRLWMRRRRRLYGDILDRFGDCPPRFPTAVLGGDWERWEERVWEGVWGYGVRVQTILREGEHSSGPLDHRKWMAKIKCWPLLTKRCRFGLLKLDQV